MFANTPEPPYYAVIFTSTQTADTEDYYAEMQVIEPLAAEQPGYLGMESARSPEGLGITVAYYDSLDAIDGWRQNVDHQRAKARGRAKWYQAYKIRIAKVETANSFERED